MRLEGANAFTDPTEYRTAMHHVFYKGEAPPKRDKRGRRPAATVPTISTPVPKSAMDRLLALNRQVAEAQGDKG